MSLKEEKINEMVEKEVNDLYNTPQKLDR